MTTPPLLPESAPFSPEQRAWLNGFFAGLLGATAGANGGAPLGGNGHAAVPANGTTLAPAPAPAADHPWHDPALTLDERMQLAEGRPLAEQYMAAMGQLDCGQCGYDCAKYAQAIASGGEAKLNLCVPGGKPTQRRLAKLKEQGAGANGAAATPAAAQVQETAQVTQSAAVPAQNAISAVPVPTQAPVVPAIGIYDRHRPGNAFLARAQRLCRNSSIKDTRLVMLDLAEAGITYEAGDSLGIYPENWEQLVEHVLDAQGYSGEEAVQLNGGAPLAVRDALMGRDLASVSPALLELIGQHATSPTDQKTLERIVHQEEQGDADTAPDVLDVLLAFPGLRLPADALVRSLDPLQPRLYSISSSPLLFPRQVHLTVDAVRFTCGSRLRKGVASTFLCERLRAGQPVPVFVQKSHGFRLPAAPETPIVMIGPGTGIAPFRAFLQERQAQGRAGKSWLFFGNPNRASDFLYEEDLAGYLKSGTLTRLDAAFSRDQSQKVYVQHLMQQQGRDLWGWLDSGAHVYVCGDAKRMARDVHQAIKQVMCANGGLSDEQAADRLAAMSREGRYQRDVY